MVTWNPDPVFATLATQDVFAALLFGEARGEVLGGQIAVANVVRNRVFVSARGQAPDDALWRAVLLKPWAFSCFDGDGGAWNARKTATFAQGLISTAPAQPTRQLLWIAAGALDDALPDVSRGATHYFVRGTSVPKWAAGRQPVAEHDAHVFYRLGDTSFT